MMHVSGGQLVERRRQRGQSRQHIRQHGRAESAQGDVQRIARCERRGQIRRIVLVKASVDGHDRARHCSPVGHETPQSLKHLADALRAYGQCQELDGNRVSVGGLAPKNGSARAGPERMLDTVAADGRWWNVKKRTFPGHVMGVSLPRES